MVVDGTRLFTGSVDRTIREWDIVSHAEISRFRGHKDTPLVLAYREHKVEKRGEEKNPHLGVLYSGGQDITVREWRDSGCEVPHVPMYRINTMDGKCAWDPDASYSNGKHLYHYPSDFCDSHEWNVGTVHDP